MSKKWNSRAPSAFSSAIAVLILLSAGAAVAQQGGLGRLAAGAQDAIQGRDHSSVAKERAAASLTSPAPTRSHGSGTTGPTNGNTGTPADTCASTVAAVRADMPTAGNTTGLAHALSVLETNCGNNPQAHGLINAIQNIGHGKGHTTNGHGGGGKPTSSPPPGPPPSHGGGKPTSSPPPSHGGGSSHGNSGH